MSEIKFWLLLLFLEYLKVRLSKEQGNLQDAIKNLHIATKRHADYFGTHCIMSVRLNIELGDLYEQTKTLIWLIHIIRKP